MDADGIKRWVAGEFFHDGDTESEITDALVALYLAAMALSTYGTSGFAAYWDGVIKARDAVTAIIEGSTP
jgi:hypothetical protein